MRTRSWGPWGGGVVVVAVLTLLECAPAPPERGVVVRAVKDWGAGYAAGLAPGDVLVSWYGADRSGPILSPLDVTYLELAETPRGPLTVCYVRNGENLEVAIPQSEWEIETAPWPGNAGPDGAWEAVVRGRALIASGETDEGRAVFSLSRTFLTESAIEAVVSWLEGQALADAGEHAAAEMVFAELVERLRVSRPGSPELAAGLAALGKERFRLMSLQSSGDALREALTTYEIFDAPLESSDIRNTLAAVALQSGDIDWARDLYRQAIAVRERLAPRSPPMAVLYTNEGIVLRRLGNLSRAEQRYREALALGMHVDPEAIQTGYVLNMLGVLAKDKGDTEEARGYYETALAIFRNKRPGKLEVAGILNNLGNLALLRGDGEAAERLHREALEIRERLRPGNLDVAASLHNLGRAVRAQGRPDASLALFEKALAIKQREAPDSPTVATSLLELGKTTRLQGDTQGAESYLRRASVILSASLPGSDDMAATLFALGSLAREEGDLDKAEALLRRAVALVDGTRDRLSYGAEERSRFQARFSEDYRELVELLVDRGRVDDAFERLESFRGRALRTLLAERDIAPGIPSEMRFARKRLEQRLDETRARLARLSVSREQSSLADLQDRIGKLEDDIDALDERMRHVSPTLAALEPAGVSLEQVRAALEPGSRLVSYSIGAARSLVFVVFPAAEAGRGVAVHTLPAGREELAGRIDRFLGFLERGRVNRDIDDALIRQGRELYDLVLAPAASSIDQAERLVIVAEGELLALPFAAILESESPRSYLATALPIRHVESAGVMVELDRRPRVHAVRSFEAFGDPSGGPASGNLPHARNEVEMLGELFGDRSHVLVGAEATERAAKSLQGNLQYLHFAGHAVLDGRFPLSSALLLAPSGSSSPNDDGFLHAWEIAEELRVEVDLVTLSACGTGRGREVRGEGLVGLARAFQIAGARSVLASLWEVSDRSTAELMIRFYRELERGLSKDDALRSAQLELASSERWRHPYHWAGFRLIGDRRSATQGPGTSNATMGDAIDSPSSSNAMARQ